MLWSFHGQTSWFLSFKLLDVDNDDDNREDDLALLLPHALRIRSAHSLFQLFPLIILADFSLAATSDRNDESLITRDTPVPAI